VVDVLGTVLEVDGVVVGDVVVDVVEVVGGVVGVAPLALAALPMVALISAALISAALIFAAADLFFALGTLSSHLAPTRWVCA